GWPEGWYKNGWVQAIDKMPGVGKLVANLEPGIVQNLRADDGHLFALPYFRGADIFVYNKKHLQQIGAQVPRTWAQFLAVARQLKAKGVVETPYSPYWISYAFLIWHQLGTEAASDGAGPFFGTKSEPLFATNAVVKATLARWQLLYKEGLVPKDIFTTSYGDITNIFGGGKSSFSLRYGPQVIGWKNPKQSRVAADITNALIPGKTHQTHSFGAYWMMAKSTKSPSDAWTLMNYLGGSGKDGKYYVPKNLIDIGLGLS